MMEFGVYFGDSAVFVELFCRIAVHRTPQYLPYGS